MKIFANRQKGIAGIEIVLSLVILAISLSTIVFVYKAKEVAFDSYNSANESASVGSTEQNANINPSTSADTGSASDNVPKGGATVSSAVQKPNGKYLTFKEWGIRLPLTDDSLKTEYVLMNDNILIGLSKQTGGDCAAATAGVARIFKFKDNEINPATQQSFALDYPGSIRVGGINYVLVGPQDICSSKTSIQDKADKAHQAVNAQFDNMQVAR